MLELLFASFFVMLASLAGVISLWGWARGFIERNLHLLLSFAIGVCVVFAYQLAGEALGHGGVIAWLMWIVAGAVVISLVCALLPHGHKHGEHEHAHIDAHRMLVTDGIHNAGDGIFLAAAFAVSPVLGFASAISVFVHEFLQEIAEFFVLRDAGYGVRRALGLNFLVSSTILVGAAGGYFLLDTFAAMEGPLLGIATGGMLVVIFYDLLPHALRDVSRTRHYFEHLLSFLLGAMLMFLLVTTLSEPEVKVPADIAPGEAL